MTSTNPALKQATNPSRRLDLSWRYATEADLERIAFTITLGRRQPLYDLSKRANRVLRFFAALNRAGSAGYRGTRCSQGAPAAAVAGATEEAANKRTVQRGRNLKRLEHVPGGEFCAKIARRMAIDY